MPDGTIVAQAKELLNGISLSNINANAGDHLLYFVTLPEYTKSFEISMWSWSIKDDGTELHHIPFILDMIQFQVHGIITQNMILNGSICMKQCHGLNKVFGGSY